MAKETGSDNSILEMFGLTCEQSKLMFSVQKMITEYDIQLTKSEKQKELKKEWLSNWEKGITDYLKSIGSQCRNGYLIDTADINDTFKEELKKSNNRTWYYILTLEVIEFAPYTPLGNENDKQYKKCKFAENSCYEYVKTFLGNQGVISTSKIDRLDKVYSKCLNSISGMRRKILTRIFAVVAIAALAAAAAAVFAGPIAVALFGGSFEGLAGAALTNACLALAGGGAIAFGGGGIAGGVAIVAGGGALLGLASGGAAVGISSMVLNSPEYTLTQAARLETILKEVILNAQQDVVSAQKIISQYQEQIRILNDKLVQMEMENEKNKKELKNIQISLNYLKKAYKDMTAFTSAYEIGKDSQAGE